MSGPRCSSLVGLVAVALVAAATLRTRSVHAQGAPAVSTSPAAAVDPSTSPPDDPGGTAALATEGFRFGGRAIYVGGGAGVVPEAGDTSVATRFNFVFPVNKAEWFAMEVGLLGQYYAVKDHHGDSISVNVGTITTGARFSLPPDRAIRPYVAPRLAHLHFFPDPYGGEHGHDDGKAEHETHHRWGAGGGIGFDAGIPGPTSRFRVGVDAEVFAISGPNVSVIGQVVALFGIGF